MSIKLKSMESVK